MSEKFFEALREKAERGTWCKNSFWRKRRAEGIDATIEALNEMMVGNMKLARIIHNMKPDGEQWTSVRCFDGEQISLDGHRGTDGEEVVVLCLKSR